MSNLFDDDAIVPCGVEKGIETYISEAPSSDDGGALVPRFRPQSRRLANIAAKYPKIVLVAHPIVDASPRASFQIGRRSSSEISDADAQSLWQDMLALQQQYNCYRSTRMQVAAGSDLGADMMPSRACIDLLNASLDDLPEEGWNVLEKYWVAGSANRGRRRWKFWQSS
ncbi:hypothetical protein F5X68DRAFT_258287 [Plectosphaerella plurivora]|uniref:Uncharacterized protein n=1 Tax=Plectosphaerella plurivora TaxID=936078 RepID=A0A9P8VN84_9PEZI|nr:hypothetical protein F5X68DRAFT_258287 [Plectosphaerella plurivora]